PSSPRSGASVAPSGAARAMRAASLVATGAVKLTVIGSTGLQPASARVRRQEKSARKDSRVRHARRRGLEAAAPVTARNPASNTSATPLPGGSRRRQARAIERKSVAYG